MTAKAKQEIKDRTKSFWLALRQEDKFELSRQMIFGGFSYGAWNVRKGEISIEYLDYLCMVWEDTAPRA